MGGAELSSSSVTDKAGMLAKETNGIWVFRYESRMLGEPSCPTSSSDYLTQAKAKYTEDFQELVDVA